jgi:hypothetical protein
MPNNLNQLRKGLIPGTVRIGYNTIRPLFCTLHPVIEYVIQRPKHHRSNYA